MYLATRDERVVVAEVAGFFGISAAHVSKVVNQLARLGYIRSIRGVGGGIELIQPANEISVGEVVTAFEGNMQLLECVGIDGVCIIENFCKLKNVLSKAEQLQVEYLQGVTLDQVLPTKKQVTQIKNLSL